MSQPVQHKELSSDTVNHIAPPMVIVNRGDKNLQSNLN